MRIITAKKTSFLFGIITFALILGACSVNATPETKLEVGMPAPAFTASAADGSSYDLANVTGQPILLSFIDTQAKGGSATADPSRAQIVFLSSMETQYGPVGLKVFIVDASRFVTGKQASQGELINFTYDWNLKNIAVLTDPEQKMFNLYAVKTLPTTFLINTQGKIEQRWDGYASASQLGLSLDKLTGGPYYRKTKEVVGTGAGNTCQNETQAQARFAGVGFARPLSDEIWVVDSGKAWRAGAPTPLQWLVLDEKGLSAKKELRIQVLGRYAGEQDTFVLIDQPLELLPADLAKGLVASTETAPEIYSLTIAGQLERTGCLEVQAIITEAGSTNTMYSSGFITVPVQ